MNKKPSRINPEVKDLSPESVVKVFAFIKKLLEDERLSTEFFKSKITNYNAGEQYIICKYCKHYFRNKGGQIYLYKWLNEQLKAYEDNGEPEGYDLLDEEISKNQLKLLNILPNYEKIALKRFRDLIRFGIPINQYLDFHRDDVIDCRVPLFYGKREFKKQFFNIWREFYTEDQVNDFYRNTFRFTNNDEKPILLYLDIDKRTYVDQQMLYTINLYRELIKYQTKKKGEDFNEGLKSKPENRRKFIRQFEDEKVIRDSFVKIMFNTFPEV